jgi:hypothetical protein
MWAIPAIGSYLVNEYPVFVSGDHKLLLSGQVEIVS